MLKKFIKAQKILNMVWCQNQNMSKNSSFQWFLIFLGGLWGPDPKVMGTIETALSRWFIWHLQKSNHTNDY